ncbi:uncharacterized protein ARMOST_16613 [Armillaria ostoyae]|uniref:Uncharacterized protein n=1 Tax=Armillaria ostoyae TaxID=47428 RepID=A0A284RWP3_ARMOS|nr:uncharacterized protein ARMOST_16613 [Armillaria ostoyae]
MFEVGQNSNERPRPYVKAFDSYSLPDFWSAGPTEERSESTVLPAFFWETNKRFVIDWTGLDDEEWTKFPKY